jgi:hypothetical protein
MAVGIHRPLKVMEFNENGIFRQHYEVSKQLQDLYIDVALLSHTNQNSYERLLYSKLSLLSDWPLPGTISGTAFEVTTM